MRPKLHQVKALVEFMEQHPELARGRLRGPLGRRRSIDLWTEVAGRLNAMGGAFKEPRVWSKYWADKKTWLKMAAAKRLRAAMQTGEDDSSVPTLTETDKKILNVLGEGFVPEPEVESAPVSPAEGYMEIKVEEGVMDHEAPCTSSHQQPQGQPRQRLRTNLAREKAELVAIEKKRVDAERVTADALSRMANAFEIFVNNSERQTAILLTLAERQIDVLQTLTEALKPNVVIVKVEASAEQEEAGESP